MGGTFDLLVAVVAYPAERLPPRSTFDAPTGTLATPPTAHGGGVWATLVRLIVHGLAQTFDPRACGLSRLGERQTTIAAALLAGGIVLGVRAPDHEGVVMQELCEVFNEASLDQGAGLEANPRSLEAATTSSAPGSPYPNQSSRTQRQSARGKRKTSTWSTYALELAISAVKAGAKIKTASRYYNIPASSLTDHLYGRTLSRKNDLLLFLKKKRRVHWRHIWKECKIVGIL